LSQDSETSSKSPETGDLNILDFIKKLRDSDELRHLTARLDFDYIRLTLQCNEICHKIDVAQEASVGLPARLTDEVEPAKEAEVETARKAAKAEEKRKETQAKKAEKAEQAKKVGEVKK
jgi:hypothetical protein